MAETRERELLELVQGWLDEFEQMDHACEGNPDDVHNCGACYGMTVATDLEHAMTELEEHGKAHCMEGGRCQHLACVLLEDKDAEG